MSFFAKRLAYFLSYSNIHGLRYLGERCGPLGKIIWSAVLMASLASMCMIFQWTLDSFRVQVVDITFDTSYLHWTSTFPQVSVCLARGSNIQGLTQMAHEYYEARQMVKPKQFYRYAKILQDYLFLNPTTYLRKLDMCATLNGSCGVDIELFRTKLLPTHCSQFMFNVTYLGEPVEDCEQLFRYLPTEMGWCYVANSLDAMNMSSFSQLPMLYDRSHPVRTLEFSYADIEVAHLHLYVLSPEMRPNFILPPIVLVNKGAHSTYTYNTVEIINAKDVRGVPIDQRQCRFPEERNVIQALIGPYSAASCFSDLRVSAEVEMCNCTMPEADVDYDAEFCDYKGLRCLAESEIMKLAKSLHTNLVKPCLQSCVEMEITMVGSRQLNIEHGPARVILAVQNVPTQRYYRRVAKTLLDAIVAVGGVVGLFFGASVLSGVEFVYIWCVRRLG